MEVQGWSLKQPLPIVMFVQVFKFMVPDWVVVDFVLH